MVDGLSSRTDRSVYLILIFELDGQSSWTDSRLGRRVKLDGQSSWTESRVGRIVELDGHWRWTDSRLDG